MDSLLPFDLPLLFAAVAAFSVAVYVLADGFDLGVGILFLAAPRDADRDVMMASIEPVWDGNETWLVMGGTLLFAAFPAGYYVLLPAFYLPIMFMLFALIFRGIAFGFRLRAASYRWVWDIAFAGGSILAGLCQGFVLGGFIGGIPMEAGMFSGGPFDCFTILGLLCGLGLLGGYALLGAGWLIWKTEGSTQIFAREVAHAALIVTAAMMAIVSGWTALAEPNVASRWFVWPNIAYLAPLPLSAAIIACFIWRSLWGKRETLPFILSAVLFLLGFAGLAVSLWPYIVPRHISIWDGAADPQALAFAGVGIVIIIPIVLAYQAHAYWVFRGKVEHSAYGEH
ncbi:cytochrome d ubiquinol oxidase subunit II [Mesorhizobium sp. M0244]|uniref:cytochrome d ubiquinol oxidase subunit II n=1 Tax=Mesorhizobium sp. M0244 TaxID=2956926 RepID=UPI0033382B8A